MMPKKKLIVALALVLSVPSVALARARMHTPKAHTQVMGADCFSTHCAGGGVSQRWSYRDPVTGPAGHYAQTISPGSYYDPTIKRQR